MSDKKITSEFERYLSELPKLADKEGLYVLVHREDKLDFFTSYEDALKAGYERFGLESFLVQQVITHPRPVNFVRNMGIISCQV